MKTGSVVNRMLKQKVCCCLFAWVLLGFSEIVSATVITWDGSKNSSWTDPANWAGDVRPANNTSQDIARFADDSESVNNQPVVNYNWAVGAVQFDGVGWTIGRSGSYVLNIGGGVTVDSTNTGSVVFNSFLYLGGNQTWDACAGTTINVNGGMGGASSTLTKIGEGNLIIRGGVDNTNTFGALVVSEGKVLLTSGVMDRRLATVTVNSGAVFGGSAPALRPVTVNDGGTLSPGYGGPGTLTLRSLSLNASSILDFELDSLAETSDQVVVEEDLILDGQLNVSNEGGLEPGTYTLFTCAGTLTDNGLDLTLPDGFEGSISTDAEGVYLQVTANAPPQAAAIVSCSSVSGDVMRLVVDAPDAASRYTLFCASNLTANAWETIGHSVDGSEPFVVSNLSYVTEFESATNEVIYVKTIEPEGFFRIIAE
ncbi:hypothetical protein [Tichowtungia aerotolerans]|uniref:Uncharacterized protein n=1 Tax=Tichowtungia aerotolerans TaxID=2697043 RepID=A0A6P1M3W7_9BACT|nr:hypothetical protein [Tichowtungia aerotolerans]QHI68531.1 hypothetical protein GT409_03365 [Tichowtungia aerotolerans]